MNPTETQPNTPVSAPELQTPPTPPVTPPPAAATVVPGARPPMPKWVWFVLAGCGGCLFLSVIFAILFTVLAGKTIQEVSKAILTITPGAMGTQTPLDTTHRSEAEVFMAAVCANLNQENASLVDFFSPEAEITTGDLTSVENLLMDCTTFDSTSIENFAGPKYEISGTLNYSTGDTKDLVIDLVPYGNSYEFTYISVK